MMHIIRNLMHYLRSRLLDSDNQIITCLNECFYIRGREGGEGGDGRGGEGRGDGMGGEGRGGWEGREGREEGNDTDFVVSLV